MTTIYADLARACEVMARRHPEWLSDPALRAVVHDADERTSDVDAVVNAIRGYQADEARSDRAVLALLSLAPAWPDALTLLVHAVSPLLRTRMGRTVTDEYRADTLVDLVFVIRDAAAHDDTAHQRRLALRLVKRAHNRVHKRHRRLRPATWSPDWIEATAETGASAGMAEVAELAVARADLARFATAIQQAVSTGNLSVSGWTAFRDHRLAGSIGRRSTPSSASQRAIAARTARRLAPYVDLHLAGHVA